MEKTVSATKKLISTYELLSARYSPAAEVFIKGIEK